MKRPTFPLCKGCPEDTSFCIFYILLQKFIWITLEHDVGIHERYQIHACTVNETDTELHELRFSNFKILY